MIALWPSACWSLEFFAKTLDSLSYYCFPSIVIIWKENQPLKVLKLYVFLTPTCQLIMSDMKKFPIFDGSDHENFSSLNYSKFALECDWKSKIFQNVRNVYFLYEIDFFPRKTRFFSRSVMIANLLQNAYQIILFNENVSFLLELRVFRRNQKNFIWKKR